jgi:hypothetical protein
MSDFNNYHTHLNTLAPHFTILAAGNEKGKNQKQGN